jgi:NAD(P)-dependent dehydrogenase (short-subunit alcohol dehydrogenase family)
LASVVIGWTDGSPAIDDSCSVIAVLMCSSGLAASPSTATPIARNGIGRRITPSAQQVAFVTGAARGQGRSHAIKLAEEGAAEGVRATVARGAAELGGLDIVVANAGILSMDSEHASDDQVFRDVLDINLVGVWNTLHSTAPLMIDAGKGGAIVIISSTQGLSGGGGTVPAGSADVAAKHGAVGLMRSFATWLAPHNIRVNTVHPTGVVTDDHERLRARLHRRAPRDRQRALQPDAGGPDRADRHQQRDHMARQRRGTLRHRSDAARRRRLQHQIARPAASRL